MTSTVILAIAGSFAIPAVALQATIKTYAGGNGWFAAIGKQRDGSDGFYAMKCAGSGKVSCCSPYGENCKNDAAWNVEAWTEVTCNDYTMTQNCNTCNNYEVMPDVCVEFCEKNGACLASEGTPPPTPCSGGTCTVLEDPHIGVFDGAQMSLLSSAVHKSGSGDKWLVKSGSVSIQARYMADESLKEENEFVRAVAVGGAFLKGNVITVGSLEDNITWNGNPILQDEVPGTSRFVFQDGNFSVNIAHTNNSLNVADLSSKNRGIDMKLPMGVSLIVNRLHHHVNVAITMPQEEGGQEGLCGNFNGLASDDTLEMTSKRLDPNVEWEESLFKGLDFA